MSNSHFFVVDQVRTWADEETTIEIEHVLKTIPEGSPRLGREWRVFYGEID